MPRHFTSVLLAILALAPAAAAQSLNIDFGSSSANPLAPATSYGAASGQAGLWNQMEVFQPVSVPLLGLQGQASGIELRRLGGWGSQSCSPGGSTFGGAGSRLMKDHLNVFGPGGLRLRITGLQNGQYLVYSYSWNPCEFNDTVFSVHGSPDGPQACTSNEIWPGRQEHQRTWVRHRVEVTQGVISFLAELGGSSGGQRALLSGMQVVFLGQDSAVGEDFCHGGLSSSAGEIGLLTAVGSGVVANNGLRLVASALPSQEFGALIASQVTVPPTFTGGLGLRCLGGTLAIFRSQIQSTGTQGSFEVPVDLTSIPLGAGHTVLAGETWGFQAIYRDSNSSQGINLTSGISVTFQ